VGEVTFTEHWDEVFGYFGGSFEDRPVRIDSADDLVKLAGAVNGDKSYAGLYIEQTSDIILSDEWTPIGAESVFSGIYNGNGMKVSGLLITSGTNKGLFGYVGGSTAKQVSVIKNLTVEGAGGESNDLTASAGGTIAGIVANVSANTLIENCVNRANIAVSAASSNIAGIAAVCVGNNIIIRNCTNYGKISGAAGINGGIAASLTCTDTENIYLTSCANHGDLPITTAATSVTGGIVGRSNNPAKVEIKQCGNYGDITLTANSTAGTGGVVGIPAGNTVIRECFNLGAIKTWTNTGAISGNIQNNSAIYNCYNKGTIDYFGNIAAVNHSGIAGNMTGAAAAPVEYCYNSGKAITTSIGNIGTLNAGGIGSANGSTVGVTNGIMNLTGIKECFYETGKNYRGGIGGGPVNVYPAPRDVEGQAEGKNTADMQTGTPYTANWDTDVWQFTAGQYPTLKNNPEVIP
jgi:hypothetical protein